MTNLKKVLCLIMAMAMMLSVMVVGAGAAKTFPDQKDIQNTEAVNMAVALNIITGRDTGEFDPTGNITRAEMAKMICILWNGGEEPKLSGSTGEATYTDINGHWAEGYIEYCSALDFIAGMGDGTFNPWGNVTGTQAAKMMMVALGFDPVAEGFNGLNWSTKIDTQANAKGLYADMTSDFKPGNSLTRDNAAQMVWNALQAYCVTYKTDWQMVNGQLTAVKVLQEKTDANNTRKVDLLEDRYDALTEEGTLIAYGYNSDKDEWTYDFDNDNDGVGDRSLTSEQDFTYLYQQHVKAVFTLKTNSTLIDTFYGMYAFKSNVIVEALVGDMDDVAASDTKVTISDVNYKLDGNGSTTDIIFFGAGDSTYDLDDVQKWVNADAYTLKGIDNDDDGRIDLIVVNPFVVAKVTYAGSKTFNVTPKSVAYHDTNSNGGMDAGEALLSYSLNTSGIEYEDVTADEGMKKDNYVIFTPAEYQAMEDDTFTIISTDNTLKGDVASYKQPSSTSLSKIRVGDTWYNMLSDAGSQIISAGGTIKDAPVVNGYVFDADGTNSISVEDYALVIGYATPGAGTGTLDTYRVKLLLSDGTKKTVDAADYNPATDDEWALGDSYNGQTNFQDYLESLFTTVSGNDLATLVTYEINSDDEYELTLAPLTTAASGYDNVYGTANDATGSSVNADGGAATVTASSDKVKYINGDNISDEAVVFMDDNDSFKVITGAKLKTLRHVAPAALISCTLAYSNDSSSGYGSVELAYVTSNSGAVTDDMTYGYITDKYSLTSRVDELVIWTADGEVTLKTESGLSGRGGISAGDVIAYTVNDDGDIDDMQFIGKTDTGAADPNSVAITACEGDYMAVTDFVQRSNWTMNGGAYGRAEFVDDTVVLLIDAADGEGVKGNKDSIATAEEPTPGTYINNAIVVLNSSNEIELVVYDVDNDIDDVQ